MSRGYITDQELFDCRTEQQADNLVRGKVAAVREQAGLDNISNVNLVEWYDVGAMVQRFELRVDSSGWTGR